MDIFHTRRNLKPGARDLESIEDLELHFEGMKQDSRTRACRLNRDKPVFRPEQLHESHNTLEYQDRSQFKVGFATVSESANPIESSCHAVNSLM